MSMDAGGNPMLDSADGCMLMELILTTSSPATSNIIVGIESIGDNHLEEFL